MADRGGLNYPIRVRDEFSETTAKFRKELRESKAAFRDFQDTLASNRKSARTLKDTAEAARALGQAQRTAAKSTSRATKALSEEEEQLQRLDAAAKAQTRREREAVRIRNAQTRDASKRAAEARKQAKEKERAAKEEERAAKAAERAGEQSLLSEQRALAAGAQAARERERAAARIFKQQKRDNENERKRLDALDPQIQAEKLINAELFKREVTLKQIGLLRARAGALAAGGDALGARDAAQQAQRLEKSLKSSARSANSLFFTFRRLVGTLAIFTLARRGVQTFNELVVGGLRFQDTIEGSTIGIAGLVATLGDVRNSLGESVSTSDELELSLGLAREQIGKLRQDSLRTVATFEQLLDTFQVAVGPGLAAGLNLDEVRALTVDISQAASALGVPQNQLAEEVRSLLSGTIQARTTRIATALGITNEDIRTLRETGELFDFLEERFAGFAEASQRQARETLDGISTLIRGIVQETLGQAAEPLFEELLALGNELFDEVLTIQDALGNIRPNPQVVRAFRSIFEALRAGVIEARAFGEALGFAGLQSALGAAGIAMQVLIGAASVVAGLAADILGLVSFIREQLGLTSEQANGLGLEFGKWGARIFIAVQLMKVLNLELLRAVRGPAILVAAFAAVAKAIEFILEKVFDVDLNLRETVELVTIGLYSAFLDVAEGVQVLAEKVSTALGNALDEIITAARSKALGARSFIASLFGDSDEAERLAREQLDEELAGAVRVANRKKQSELDLADIRAQAAAKQLALEAEIANIIGRSAERGAQGAGFDPNFDPEAAASAAAAFVSTADKPINELGESLLRVNDALRESRLEFEALRSGSQGQFEGIFDEGGVESAKRLQKINGELAKTQETIAQLKAQSGVSDERLLQINEALLTRVQDREAAIEALAIQEGEGGLVSALRDQILLRDAIAEADRQALALAVQRAAIQAETLLPSMREELALMRAQLGEQRAVSAAELAGLGTRDLAIIQAEAALELAREQGRIEQENATRRIQDAQLARDQAAVGSEERASLQAVLDGLVERRDLEAEILAINEQRLLKAAEEAALFRDGTFAQGARRGLEELRDELPTIFEAGLELTKSVVTGFADFASREIVNAIVNAQQEGVDSSDLFKQAAAQFAQELATQILQTVVQTLIQQLLSAVLGRAATELTVAGQAASIRLKGAILAGEAEIAAATTAAGIRAGSGGAGFHSGGLVQGFNAGGFVQGMAAHFSSMAIGLARGGRPPGIHPSDTVPAWLTPGEFVMSRAAVQAIGLPTLTAMNQGNFQVTGSASAEAAGPAVGMQTGGLVSDRLESAQNSSQEGRGGDTILPVLVAKDREMDQLTAGGRNAFLQFMREEAGNINTLLDRSAGRGR